MTTNLTELTALRRGADVKRWHVERTVGPPQTVGHHSHGVALLLLALWPNSSGQILREAIWHDIPESVTGDVPAHVKHAHPAVAEAFSALERAFSREHDMATALSKIEQARFNFCDMLDAALYCHDQRKLGNTELDGVFLRITVWMHKVNEDFELGQEPLLAELIYEWQKVTGTALVSY